MNLYVGNMSYDTTEEELLTAFGQFGEVANVSLIKDRFTGRSRGFGFVEMPNATEAQAAIEGLNGQDFQERRLTVSEARPKPAREGGGRGRERSGDRDRSW